MKEVIEIFEDANHEFLVKERNLVLSGVSERALCGSLMVFIKDRIRESNFSRYYADVEFNRNDGKIKTIRNNSEQVITITCDLIVHSRGEIIEQDNLIALEMKKSTATQEEKDKDRERLIALTKDSIDNLWSYDGTCFPEHVCRYKLGIYYEINLSKTKGKIEYYKQGALFKKYEVIF
jgi:hypothetical protein